MAVDTDIAHQLLDILGDEGTKELSKDEKVRVGTLLSETIGLVEAFRRKHNFIRMVPEKDLINDLFSGLSWKTSDAALKNNDRLSQCLLEMLRWLSKVVDEGRGVPTELIKTLVVGVSNWSILGSSFCKGRMGRAFGWIPKDTFDQTAYWFLYNQHPRRLASEFLMIFSLRQTMEVALRRIIGFQSVDFKAKLRHDVIWNILFHHVTKKNFSPPSNISLDQVKHVYDWTEKFIHNMERDYVCVVWKAVMVVAEFFMPTERQNGQMSVHDNFEFTESVLNAMQDELVDALRNCAVRQHIAKFNIDWMKPEAAIVDDCGRFKTIKPRSQTVLCEGGK